MCQKERHAEPKLLLEGNELESINQVRRRISICKNTHGFDMVVNQQERSSATINTPSSLPRSYAKRQRIIG